MTVHTLLRYCVRPIALPAWCGRIHRDYRRYRATGESALTTIFLTQGFWATCVYRISRSLVGANGGGGSLRGALRPLTAAAQKTIEILTGICMPRQCDIGDGVYIGHFGSIIFPAEGRVGSNCNIGQNVTLGVGGKGAAKGAPVIGNRVFIGAHSVIVGRISVGDDAMICAGAVVTRSVPARAVVMGNPAKVISYEGSFDYVLYDGMEEDPDRRASMQLALEHARKHGVLTGVGRF